MYIFKDCFKKEIIEEIFFFIAFKDFLCLVEVSVDDEESNIRETRYLAPEN